MKKKNVLLLLANNSEPEDILFTKIRAKTGADSSRLTGRKRRIFLLHCRTSCTPVGTKRRKLYLADVGFAPRNKLFWVSPLFHTTVWTHVEWISSDLAEIFRLRRRVVAQSCWKFQFVSGCVRNGRDTTDVIPTGVRRAPWLHSESPGT